MTKTSLNKSLAGWLWALQRFIEIYIAENNTKEANKQKPMNKH